VLEKYSLHQLPAAELARLEEHLLLCEDCCQALGEVEQYVALQKSALQELSQPVPAPGKRSLFPVWSSPAWSWAGAGALATLAVVLILPYGSNKSGNGVPTPVALASFRGAEAQVHAPANKPLQLQLEAADVAGDAKLRLELVSADGQPVWSGKPRNANGKLESVAPGQSAGSYWVRLYGADSELVREFGLRVD
jgi:hypothetical protein